MSARLLSAWRHSWRGLAVLAIVGAMAAALPVGGFAETAAVKVRFGGDQTSTRIVLDIGHAVQGKLVSGGQGGREVVMEFPKLATGALEGQGRGLVDAWTLERTVGGARLKLVLDKGAKVEKRFLLAPADGVSTYRYVIDLKAAGPAAPAPRTAIAAAASAKPAVQKVSIAALAAPVRSASAKKTIVIDAGHGGRDGGAAGSAINEKDVTLAAAKTLKARLEKTGRYRVVMTRQTDTYIALENRVTIARKAQADLLISLHADASANPETRGASVYTLSDQGSSRVARRQGGGGFLNVALPGGTKAVKDILFDLTQRATRNKSSAFAEILISKVGGHAPLLSRAHRDAGYVLLLAPDVPSVLFEMGFMTNRADEALLKSENHRAKVVAGIASAIDEYFSEEEAASVL